MVLLTAVARIRWLGLGFFRLQRSVKVTSVQRSWARRCVSVPDSIGSMYSRTPLISARACRTKVVFGFFLSAGVTDNSQRSRSRDHHHDQSIIAGDFVERARDCPFECRVLMSRLSALTRLTTDRDGRLAPQIIFLFVRTGLW